MCCNAEAAMDDFVRYSLVTPWAEEPSSRVFMMRIIANG
jgi:hypothetical protein